MVSSDIQHGCYSGAGQHDHPNSIPKERKLTSNPIIIEDNVWIGESVSILPGVTIGQGSIVGANSLVSKNIPPYAIAVGNPAKVIKTYNFTIGKWEKI
jgi:lipopolysaccharide O-acetyltransferase